LLAGGPAGSAFYVSGKDLPVSLVGEAPIRKALRKGGVTGVTGRRFLCRGPYFM